MLHVYSILITSNLVYLNMIELLDIYIYIRKMEASQAAQLISKPPHQCRRPKRHGFDLWVRKIPLEKKMATYSSILAGKLHGQRSLMGYSPWGRKESDVTEHTYACIRKITYSFNFSSFFFSIIAYYIILNIVPCAIQ